MEYVLIFILKFVDCILGNIRTKALINGNDRIANILKAIATIVYMFMMAKAFVNNNFLGIFVAGIAEYFGGEVGTFIFNKIQKDKPYEFIVRFINTEFCIQSNNELRENNIKTYFKENSKKLIIDSKNKEQSKLIEKIIDGRFKNLKKNELKEYIKN